MGHECRHPPQMQRHPAKLLLDHCQPFEAMAHGQLVGHAHAAAVFDLLSSLPADFMAEGRQDTPPQEREGF